MPKITQPIGCKASMQTQACPELEANPSPYTTSWTCTLPGHTQPHSLGSPASPGHPLSSLAPFDQLPLLPELVP